MDDCGGEMMGHVMNLLMANGAREVHYTPIYTKKNRPAYTLTVICKESEREKLENLIFSETTTIGIRRVEMERTILQREEGYTGRNSNCKSVHITGWKYKILSGI